VTAYDTRAGDHPAGPETGALARDDPCPAEAGSGAARGGARGFPGAAAGADRGPQDVNRDLRGRRRLVRGRTGGRGPEASGGARGAGGAGRSGERVNVRACRRDRLLAGVLPGRRNRPGQPGTDLVKTRRRSSAASRQCVRGFAAVGPSTGRSASQVVPGGLGARGVDDASWLEQPPTGSGTSPLSTRMAIFLPGARTVDMHAANTGARPPKPFAVSPVLPVSRCRGHCIPSGPEKLTLSYKVPHRGTRYAFVELAQGGINGRMPATSPSAPAECSQPQRPSPHRRARVLLLGVTTTKDIGRSAASPRPAENSTGKLRGARRRREWGLPRPDVPAGRQFDGAGRPRRRRPAGPAVAASDLVIGWAGPTGSGLESIAATAAAPARHPARGAEPRH